MIYFLLGLLVWVFVAVGCHRHRAAYYKKNPHMWNRRHECLIAFSDRQYWWIMTLWPLAITAAVIFILAMWILAAVEVLKDAWVKMRDVK